MESESKFAGLAADEQDKEARRETESWMSEWEDKDEADQREAKDRQ